MKTHKLDLDIDFIGGEEKLTRQEEQVLSEYFKNAKLRKRHKASTSRQKKKVVG